MLNGIVSPRCIWCQVTFNGVTAVQMMIDTGYARVGHNVIRHIFISVFNVGSPPWHDCIDVCTQRDQCAL